ncbi:hypothetical protein MTR67_011869 [Solanum verrucosum]|uniref:Tf2-1-like SH3-like domain-containing protein n=1 Tax=Solanum verrucosum TaxID=315347 RepID=A0AAF0QEN8_SOLVR|nr:hypothetical protein MTR67_011869 [Solanum verrucosum]
MKGVMRFGRRARLIPKYIGLFKILQMIGEVAYELALPPIFWPIHPVFHVSMLCCDSIQGSSTPLKDKDEALETPRRPITRSQTKEFNDKLNGLQSLIQRCLIREKELKPKGEELSKWSIRGSMQLRRLLGRPSMICRSNFRACLSLQVLFDSYVQVIWCSNDKLLNSSSALGRHRFV